ncbi:MAG TPA: DoxX family protein [Candidatus Caenarcaniphilales bacterium]
MKNLIPLLARIFLAAIFMRSGLGKLLDPAGTQQQMAAAGIPLTGLLLVGSIIFELVGGLAVLLGYKARIGAIALILFLIPTTLIFHTNFSEPMQINQFLKNLGIMGGLLLITYYGAGPKSLDEKTSSRSRW